MVRLLDYPQFVQDGLIKLNTKSTFQKIHKIDDNSNSDYTDFFPSPLKKLWEPNEKKVGGSVEVGRRVHPSYVVSRNTQESK